MVSEHVVDRLSLFVDDELDPIASREISRHLESCSSCAAALAQQQQLREDLKRDLEYHRSPDLLRARVMRDTRAPARRDGVHILLAAQPWRWLGAAAAVIAVAGGTWLFTILSHDRVSDAIAHEAVSGHLRSLMANHLTDVASTDQHTVKPWFGGKLDFSPPVTDFAGAGYPLIGGRLDYLQNRPVAALVYQRRRHVINVFVWPVAGAHEGIGPVVTQRGFHVIGGGHAGMAYWVVSDLNTEDLLKLARLLVGEERGQGNLPGSGT